MKQEKTVVGYIHYKISYKCFTHRRLNVNHSILVLLSTSYNDTLVLARYFSHLIMTNRENDPVGGKCSVEFQTTQHSLNFEQSLSILCQMGHNTEDIVLITFQNVCSSLIAIFLGYKLSFLCFCTSD